MPNSHGQWWPLARLMQQLWSRVRGSSDSEHRWPSTVMDFWKGWKVIFHKSPSFLLLFILYCISILLFIILLSHILLFFRCHHRVSSVGNLVNQLLKKVIKVLRPGHLCIFSSVHSCSLHLDVCHPIQSTTLFLLFCDLWLDLFLFSPVPSCCSSTT